MYRFWDSVIEPVLDILQPAVLVEVGSDHGPNTRKLLDFCERHGARLHVIDPLPKYDILAWQERYGEHFIFHQALSLDAIPLIDRFDLVFIDGDHNWYTVFNELKLIEERCYEMNLSFPLVMLHDVGWPYGRRDGYYAPDQIPAFYRNPYERKGMEPGSSKLLDEGGFNQGFCNALYEGGPRNGVLTAVEDFLAQTAIAIDLVKIPGLHGLGILAPRHLKQDKKLSVFLETLDPTSAITLHIESIEKARLITETDCQQRGTAIRKLEARRQKETRALESKLHRHTENLRAQNQKMQQQLQSARQREKRLKQQLANLQEQLRGKECTGLIYYLKAIGKRMSR